MKSSTAVYGSGPGEPSILPEDHASRQVELSGLRQGLRRGRDSTRATSADAVRTSISSILRTQNVIGPTVHTNMTDYLSLPVLPTALGLRPAAPVPARGGRGRGARRKR